MEGMIEDEGRSSRYNHINEHERKREGIEKLYRRVGITHIVARKEMDWDQMVFAKLTLHLRPRMNSLAVNNNANLSAFLGERYSETAGYYGDMSTSVKISFPEDEQGEPVKLRNREVGRYFKERNLIIICYNPFYWDWGHCKLVSHLKTHRELAEAIAQVNPQEVDVTERIKEMMLKGFQEGAINEINDTVTMIKDEERQIKDYEKLAVEKYRSNDSRRIKIKSLNKLINKMKDGLMEEIENIRGCKFVEKVELEDGELRVYVGKISLSAKVSEDEDEHSCNEGCENSDDCNYIEMDVKVYVGNYVIVYTPNNIRIKNLDIIPSSEYAHPHISQYDVPCWGDAGPKFIKLLAEFKLKELTFNIYSWLKTYNSDSPHRNLGAYHRDREEEDKFNEIGELLKR